MSGSGWSSSNLQNRKSQIVVMDNKQPHIERNILNACKAVFLIKVVISFLGFTIVTVTAQDGTVGKCIEFTTASQVKYALKVDTMTNIIFEVSRYYVTDTRQS